MKLRHWINLIVLIAFLLAGLHVNDAVPAAAAEAGIGYVRGIHASADAPNVDIYVNGSRMIRNLNYGNATDWLPLPAGQTYEIALRAANAAATSEALVTESYTLANDASLALVVMGLAAPQQDQPALTLKAYAINRLDPKGNARIDVINTIPDAPPVDILLNGAAVIRTLRFGRKNLVSLDVPALDPVDLEVTAENDSDQVFIDLTGWRVESGKIYTVVAIGTGSRIRALLLTSNPYAAFIRLVHASPAPFGVDVYIDGKFVYGSVYFAGFSNFLPITAGVHTIALRLGDASPFSVPIAELKGVNFDTNSSTLLVALGKFDQSSLQPLSIGVYPINRASTGGTARVYAIHTAADAPNVDVAFGAGSPPAIRNLRYGRQNTVPMLVKPGTTDVEIRVTETADVAISAPGTLFRADTIYTILAIGSGSSLQALVLNAPVFDPLNP